MRPWEALREEFKVTLLLRVDPALAQPPARPKVTPPQILRQQPSLVALVPAQVRDQTLHFCCRGHGCSIPGRGTQVPQAPDPTHQKMIRESLDNLADTQSSQERHFRHTVPEEWLLARFLAGPLGTTWPNHWGSGGETEGRRTPARGHTSLLPVTASSRAGMPAVRPLSRVLMFQLRPPSWPAPPQMPGAQLQDPL